MPIPDLTNLTLDEVRELIGTLNNLYAQLVAEQSTERDQRRIDIGGAITALDTLLGAVDGEPGTSDIRAIRRYDVQTMGENAGLALSLAFEGLEILTSTILDIAHVIASND